MPQWRDKTIQKFTKALDNGARVMELHGKRVISTACHYCGNWFNVKRLTFDHVTPVAKGGLNNPKNLVLSCRLCNERQVPGYLSTWMRKKPGAIPQSVQSFRDTIL